MAPGLEFEELEAIPAISSSTLRNGQSWKEIADIHVSADTVFLGVTLVLLW